MFRRCQDFPESTSFWGCVINKRHSIQRTPGQTSGRAQSVPLEKKHDTPSMKTSLFLLSVIGIGCSFALPVAAEPEDAFHNPSAPPAGKVSQSLFWIADSRKMDTFLASFPMDELHVGATKGEVLPDTRVAWRDYAREATALARQGRNADAASRLAQMLKLAAVYRAFGGLQNVAQGEEIRHLAGVTAERLGKPVTSLLHSPYLEKDAADCLLAIEAQITADEKLHVSASFWHHFEREAVNSHYRLTGGSSEEVAAAR